MTLKKEEKFEVIQDDAQQFAYKLTHELDIKGNTCKISKCNGR
jgi:hypothetical protein